MTDRPAPDPTDPAPPDHARAEAQEGTRGEAEGGEGADTGRNKAAGQKPVPAVRCRGLTFRFGDHVAVDHIHLEVAPGEIFGLLGPNGAGKTTTIRALNTLLPAEPGTAEVFGVDVAKDPFTVRRLLGYVPQQLSADASLTGRENLMLFARLFDVPRHERRALVEESLEAMGVADAANRPVATYSGGMVRRLEMAQALVNSPRLLVLDEPTIGLDPIGRSGVWERVQELRDRTGMTVLLTTHYMDEADQLCDRLAMMHQGRIRAAGTPRALKDELSPTASLEDVFRYHAGGQLDELDERKGETSVRTSRRTASRLS